MMKSDPITATSRIRVTPNVYTRVFGTELVLLDFGRGEYFGLDEVGADVWRRCEAGDAVGVIAASIVAAYEVAPETALEDVVALVVDLRDKGLLSVLPI